MIQILGESFFETCAILLTLIMLGRFVEVYAKEKTRKNLTHLVSAPRKCSVVKYVNKIIIYVIYL